MLISIFNFRFTLFLVIGLLYVYLCGGNSHIRCMEKERQALLMFKGGLNDTKNLLSSWKVDADCCNWRGILCNNQTGHITKLMLDLSKFSDPRWTISGKIDPSLCELQDLTYLDLSYFNFEGHVIPKCIGSLGQLRNFTLRYDELHGIIPHELSNLSNLQNLDLGDNYDLTIKDLSWISHLSSLRYIDLSGVKLSHSIGWPSFINKVPSLLELRLEECGLGHFNRKSLFTHVNSSTTLKFLDLGDNNLNSAILSWVFNVSKVLIHLDLSYNFDLTIKDLTWISHLSLLRYIDLSYIDLSHSIGWPSFMNKVPSLLELRLRDCRLVHFNHKSLFTHVNSSTTLKVLDLGFNSLNSSILSWVFNVSKALIDLDLSCNHNLIIKDLSWISHLSSLRYIDLSGVDLSHSIDWPSLINKVPSLLELGLEDCGLAHFNHKSLFTHVNSSTTLKVLYLGFNNLNSSILSWVFNVSKALINLYLPYNDLHGFIPDAIANMAFLKYVDFSENQLTGGIPKSFYHLCHLQELELNSNNLSGKLADSLQCLCPKSLQFLDLSDNRFSSEPIPEISRFSSLETLYLANTSLEGMLPHSFGYLPYLQELDLRHNNLSGSLPEFKGLPSMGSLYLSYNKLNGIINEKHLSHLSELSFLDVSHNVLSFNFSSNWVPPFQLQGLSASFCNIGPHFPVWLKSQRKLEFLDLSNSGISDLIPKWFWHLSSNIGDINFSQNNIHGTLPKSLYKSHQNHLDISLDFSFNNLSGPLPICPPTTGVLRLSNNMLSGSLTSYCTTPQSGLTYLDVSNNFLSGELPDCWDKFKLLMVLNLANNNFSGKIPKSIWFLAYLETIHLNNNNFSGGIPSLVNCTSLYSIDLGENSLNGTLPTWIGHKLVNLVVLHLRKNKFRGRIPKSLCNLNHLRVLDLSQNKISGKIPDCLNNIDALSNITFPKDIMAFGGYSWGYNTFESFSIFIDEAILTWKGENYEYRENLGLMTMIDFSCNHLYGEIPSTMTSLLGLVSLNLSRKNLTGYIPNNFGELKSLESLDLSWNGLFGRIPSSFSNLTWLAFLNLSFNNLLGEIPSSTQLQSFDPSAYMRNIGLCGPPLKKECLGHQKGKRNDNENATTTTFVGGDDEIISFEFYVSLVLGFIIGFWGVCGSLILKSSWRQAYFQFLSNMYDWLIVHVIVFATRMKRRF